MSGTNFEHLKFIVQSNFKFLKSHLISDILIIFYSSFAQKPGKALLEKLQIQYSKLHQLCRGKYSVQYKHWLTKCYESGRYHERLSKE
jgi:hypothetical protein